jgi:hypothetical protein
MKLVILLLAVALTMAMTSCQPCEQECKFTEGDEIEMVEKSALNNNGQVIEVSRHTNCECYYTVKYSNMLNFTVEDEFDEFELRDN